MLSFVSMIFPFRQSLISVSKSSIRASNLNLCNGMGSISSRAYSMWPEEFQNPVSKSGLKELQGTEEYDKLRKAPIKAALNEASCCLSHDPLVDRFRNMFMERGKKEIADRQLRLIFKKIKETQLQKYNRMLKTVKDTSEVKEELLHSIDLNPNSVVNKAVENGRPLLALRVLKMGGVIYDVPVPITLKKSQFLGMKWMIQAARKRPDTLNVPFHEAMAEILTDTAEQRGQIIAKKHEYHRFCEQNRAYAHYVGKR